MPEPHHKPTKEELKAQQEAALAEAEKIEKEGLPPEEETPEPEPEPEMETGEVEVFDAPEPEKEETPEPEPEPEQAEPSKELYKKKFSESSRENQKINAKNRVINQAISQAEDVPEPTEEDLVKEYPDWDMMSDIEKTLAKETVISRNWRQLISEAKNQATKIEKWNDSVAEFADDPKTLTDNPDLEGKTEAFKAFATEEANNNVPLPILVGAFLHQQSAGKTSNKGRMFERAVGGSNEKPELRNGKISLEEGRKLRQTDYNKWKEYLHAGKIDMGL